MKLRFPLTVKLMLLIAAIVAVPILALGVLSVFLRQAMQADVEKKIETTLTLAMNMELSLMDEGLFAMKQVATAVAADPEVASTLAQPGRGVRLERFARVFPRADMMVLVNRDGTVISRSGSERVHDRFLLDGLVEKAMQEHAPQAYPALITSAELINESPLIHTLVTMPVQPTRLSTDPRAGSRVETALALVGVVPVLDAQGRVLGAAIAADLLNRDFRIVDEVASRSPAEVPMNATIAMDGIRVTTNVRLKDPDGHDTDQRALGTIYSDMVMDSLRQNKVYRGRALVVGEWQRTIYSPVTDYRGQVIAGPYVGIPEGHFTAVADRITYYYRIGLLVVGAALCVALLIGFWLTRRGIVSPVRRFTQQIRSGNLTGPIHHPAHDEIGDLATTLDALLRRIREVVNQVLSVADEVSQASRALHDSASATSAEAADVAAIATGALQRVEQVREGAGQTIDRLRQLSEAVALIAEGAQRQERSVRYTGMVAEEIALAIEASREQVGQAMDAANTVTAGARAGLRRAADFTAAIAVLRQGTAGRDAARLADLLREPADLLTNMSGAAERLAEVIRGLVLTVQENQARLTSIQQEMGRVGQAVGATAESTGRAGETADQVIRWMEATATDAAALAQSAQSTQAAVNAIAAANLRLTQMAAGMDEAAARLRQALGRFEENVE